jgi:fumarylacetoacetase
MSAVNATHDARLRSWVDSANRVGTDFPVQNLPLGVFRRRGSDERWRVGTAIGDAVADVGVLAREEILGPAFGGSRADALLAGSLNALMASGSEVWSGLRGALSLALRDGAAEGERARGVADRMLVPAHDVELRLPATIGDYTDFYASIDHATNVGSMFRPDNPLLPNYKWVPIGYHGRSSSIVASGCDVRRPVGQLGSDEGTAPAFGATRRLDYEAELGFFVGRGNAQGQAIPIAVAGSQLFGACLLNDWSARDIQAWEYQPLGPFLSKSFATTISPWVVTCEALAPFRAPARRRAAGDPAPLPYLTDERDQGAGALDITVSVSLRSARMRASGAPAVVLSNGSAADLYWTPAQLLAHHASNGCNLRSGDLLGSGTISGPLKENRGCLLELTWRGSEPVTLPGGELRRFLEDADEVVMRGRCEREGFASIGFGECTGTVVAA